MNQHNLEELCEKFDANFEKHKKDIEELWESGLETRENYDRVRNYLKENGYSVPEKEKKELKDNIFEQREFENLRLGFQRICGQGDFKSVIKQIRKVIRTDWRGRSGQQKEFDRAVKQLKKFDIVSIDSKFMREFVLTHRDYDKKRKSYSSKHSRLMRNSSVLRKENDPTGYGNTSFFIE